MTVFFRVDVAASVFAILVGTYHLCVFAGWFGTPPDGAIEFFWRIGWSIAIIIALTIVSAIISSGLDQGSPERDEREDQVQYRAGRNMAIAYGFGLITLLWNAFILDESMQLAHAIIAILVGAEIVRVGSLAYYLRRAI